MFAFVRRLLPLLVAGFGAAPSQQVGLTGKTVSPNLYIAVAISGASQHMAGMAGSKNIVAINKDADSNMVKVSKFAIIDDYKKVVPALIEDIRSTGTHLAVTPEERARLAGQGVAPAVLDELAAAQARWAQDQATADKVRADTARIEAADRARAEEERRRRAYYGPTYSPYYSPYRDPMWPYGYPGRRGYGGGFGWGVQIRR